MADWHRLAQHITRRRVALGYTNRDAFAEKSGISPRTLGDLERGNKENYYASKLAAVEQALGWTAGSVEKTLAGGEPTVMATLTDNAGATDTATTTVISERDQLIISIMERDDISDDQKRHIAEILIAQREAAERAREESARRLVDLVRRRPDN